MTGNSAEDPRLPYRLREPFLTSTELALFRVLNEMMGERFVICPKVGLNDVFYILRPNENVHFFNKIFRKHVDFLLCDPATFAPAFGVELVKQVGKENSREVDKFMADLFLDAGLPLVHIPSSEQYAEADIVSLFQIALTRIGGTRAGRNDQPADSVPNCPVCGKMMVLRIHRSGVKTGRKYYGCMDSPRCSGSAAID